MKYVKSLLATLLIIAILGGMVTVFALFPIVFAIFWGLVIFL